MGGGGESSKGGEPVRRAAKVRVSEVQGMGDRWEGRNGWVD